MGLYQKKILDERIINKIFNSEIEEEEYEATIKQLLEKKNELITEEDALKKRDKLYRYLISKGYESELIVKMMNVGYKK